MGQLKHNKPTRFILFLSVLFAVIITATNLMPNPTSDFFLILQRIVLFLLSLLISGIMLTYLSKTFIWGIIIMNSILVLFYIVK